MRAALLVTLLAAAASAHAQQFGGLYQNRQAAVTPQAGAAQAPTGYRLAARTGVSVPTARRPAAKPFAHASQAPVISPYINLYREETENAAPNYHVFVQPQLQQQQLFQSQQQQLLQLQRRLQASPQQQPAAPTQSPTFGGARYGDLGHYYGGLRR